DRQAGEARAKREGAEPLLGKRDLRAGLFELLLEVLGLGLANALLEDLGRALDEVLRLLEAEARDLADDLDHVDLVGAGVLELDVELGLLLRSRGRSRAAADGGTRDG